MAPAIGPPPEACTPIGSNTNSDRPLSVKHFVGNSECMRSLPKTEDSGTLQDGTSSNYQLTGQRFLHERPVTLLCPSAEAALTANAQPVGLAGHDTEATNSGPCLLDPPESIPSETDNNQVSSPAPEARRLRSRTTKGSQGRDVSMQIPKVVRTYTKKIKPKLPVRDHSSAMPLTRSFTQDGALLVRNLDDASDSSAEQSASRKYLKARPMKNHTSAGPWKHKRQILQEEEKNCQEDRRNNDANTMTATKRKRPTRKKRRAPVHGLPLVTRLPSLEISAVEAQVRASSWYCAYCLLISSSRKPANLTILLNF